MQNKYPTLPPPTNQIHPQYPQNSVPYSSLPQYHHEPIQVGVPVQSHQIPPQYPPVHNAIPYSEPFPPHNTRPDPQYVPYGYNPQTSEPSYSYDHYNYPTETQNFPQGETRLDVPTGNPMVNTGAMPDPNYRNINAEMIPVVYDPAILYKIASREPQLAHCKKCNKYVQTTVKYEIGTGTLISSTCMALFGALACAWIPCCINDLKDAVHYCPVCKEMVGKKKFIVN